MGWLARVRRTQQADRPTMSPPETLVDVDIGRRVTAEYRDMPGLCLTVSQAARFWGLHPDVCCAVIDGLVRQGVLRRTTKGAVVLAR
ncbi:MAG: hypothetical protein AB7U25_16275 [Vicinamibacterales bacterium]